MYDCEAFLVTSRLACVRAIKEVTVLRYTMLHPTLITSPSASLCMVSAQYAARHKLLLRNMARSRTVLSAGVFPAM